MQTSVVQGVGVITDLGCRGILEKPVDKYYIASHHLFAISHCLASDYSVVNDELEIEAWDQCARVTFACGRVVDVPQTPLEGEISTLDRILNRRSIDAVRSSEDKRCVTLELGKNDMVVEGRPQ